MFKEWEVLPITDKNSIKSQFGFEPVIERLLHNRGLYDQAEISKFLFLDSTIETFDPFLFNDMEEAVEIIINNIKGGRKIVIYGDYDADGVTAAVILFEILKLLKAVVSVYIPERVSEGYGLNIRSLDSLAAAGISLIITVDCGIRNFAEVKYAKEKGLTVIVTDHHIPPERQEEIPNCPVIDPMMAREKYPFKFLAGAGVALKLASAVLMKAKIKDEDKEKILKKTFDILAIGTIADCVPLIGENRALTKIGLQALNSSRRVGLLALVNSAKIGNGNKIDAWHVSFQIAPRLNAAGRMEHANTAFKLLTTQDREEAFLLAEKLNQNNIKRQKNTEEIIESAEKNNYFQNNDKVFISVCQIDEKKEEEIWNEGVIGLVAGKICEKYYLPALVITKTKDGYKGSGRSIPDFNLIAAMEEAAEFLEKFGGHAAACGFSLKAENLPNFINKIKIIAKDKLSNIKLVPKLIIDAEISFDEINEKLVSELTLFEPFGQNNEKPKFVSYGCLILDIFNMGSEGQHLKLKIKGGQAKIFNALGFGQTEKWRNLQVGDIIDIVYYIEINEFNGRSEVQLKIIDIKKSNL